MGFIFLFDPLYLVFMGAGLLISLGASALVKWAYAKYSKIGSFNGYSGAETARAILARNEIHDVTVEPVEGFLSDHYDPTRRVLRLSKRNFNGNSLAAVGVAAHEAGHALQHARGYAPMGLRHLLVPVANIGSQLGVIMIIIGVIIGALGIAKIGIVLFASVLLFQLVTLPVEFNASGRALRALRETGILSEGELSGAAWVLRAAALTYVAGAVTTLLMLLYYVLLVSGRD